MKKYFLLFVVAFGLSAGVAQAADNCSVPPQCTFIGWYSSVNSCRLAASPNNWITGNSANCSDGNACVACFSCAY